MLFEYDLSGQTFSNPLGSIRAERHEPPQAFGERIPCAVPTTPPTTIASVPAAALPVAAPIAMFFARPPKALALIRDANKPPANPPPAVPRGPNSDAYKPPLSAPTRAEYMTAASAAAEHRSYLVNGKPSGDLGRLSKAYRSVSLDGVSPWISPRGSGRD